MKGKMGDMPAKSNKGGAMRGQARAAAMSGRQMPVGGTGAAPAQAAEGLKKAAAMSGRKFANGGYATAQGKVPAQAGAGMARAAQGGKPAQTGLARAAAMSGRTFANGGKVYKTKVVKKSK